MFESQKACELLAELRIAKRRRVHDRHAELRYLQTLTEIGVEKNTTIVFPLPLNILEGLSQMGRERATGSMLPKGAAFST